MSQHGSYTLERDAFDELFAALARRGYTVVGPKVRDQAIVYDEILRDMPSSAPGHAIYTPWHPRTRAARRRP
jgi:hypothetical protein